MGLNLVWFMWFRCEIRRVMCAFSLFTCGNAFYVRLPPLYVQVYSCYVRLPLYLPSYSLYVRLSRIRPTSTTLPIKIPLSFRALTFLSKHTPLHTKLQKSRQLIPPSEQVNDLNFIFIRKIHQLLDQPESQRPDEI